MIYPPRKGTCPLPWCFLLPSRTAPFPKSLVSMQVETSPYGQKDGPASSARPSFSMSWALLSLPYLTNIFLCPVTSTFLFSCIGNRCLRRRKPCDRNPKRRAGHIIQPYLMAKLHGGRIAAVFSADTEL